MKKNRLKTAKYMYIIFDFCKVNVQRKYVCGQKCGQCGQMKT